MFEFKGFDPFLEAIAQGLPLLDEVGPSPILPLPGIRFDGLVES